MKLLVETPGTRESYHLLSTIHAIWIIFSLNYFDKFSVKSHGLLSIGAFLAVFLVESLKG